MGLFDRLRKKPQHPTERPQTGGLFSKIATLLRGGALSDESLQQIQEQLLLADVGLDTSNHIVDQLRTNMQRHHTSDDTLPILRKILLDLLQARAVPLTYQADTAPFVVLVIGVNGAGKTTTIGKLAHQLKQQGMGVLLAAGDTFRAGAIEQLRIWGERCAVPVIAQQPGADAAAVIFDAITSARARNMDVVIADTSGRLHTQKNLLGELEKITRVIGKCQPDAPHEVLLVLDGSSGQNAISQVKLFSEAIAVTGLAITKLDGTAKGGVLLALAGACQLPVRYVGLGENLEDLQVFDAESFIDSLLQIAP